MFQKYNNQNIINFNNNALFIYIYCNLYCFFIKLLVQLKLYVLIT